MGGVGVGAGRAQLPGSGPLWELMGGLLLRSKGTVVGLVRQRRVLTVL